MTFAPRKKVLQYLVRRTKRTRKDHFIGCHSAAILGKLNKCSNRGRNVYEKFLMESITRGIDPSEGAALELEFGEGYKQTTVATGSNVPGVKKMVNYLKASRSAKEEKKMNYSQKIGWKM